LFHTGVRISPLSGSVASKQSHRLVNEKYSEPENSGPQTNSAFSDHDPCLPNDEHFMICTSVEREDGLGEGDLYYSIKDADGSGLHSHEHRFQ
jgi:hypothetical protein